MEDKKVEVAQDEDDLKIKSTSFKNIIEGFLSVKPDQKIKQNILKLQMKSTKKRVRINNLFNEAIWCGVI